MPAFCSKIKQSTLQASIQLVALQKATWSPSPNTRKIEKWRRSFCLAMHYQPLQLLLVSKLLWTVFFEAKELSWQNFQHICNEVLQRWFASNEGLSHCSLHRCTLALKTLPLYLMEVIDVAVKAINFIRLWAKYHRLPIFGQRNGSATYGTFLRKQKQTPCPISQWRVCCDACVPGRCIRPPQRRELVFAMPWYDNQRH